MPTESRASYPTGREQFHAMKLLFAAYESGAVADIGRDGLVLLGAIATLEDKLRYRREVTFHNSELQRRAGFSKWEQLDRARKRLVKHGWIYYRSQTRRPGVYWTLNPCEESPPESGDGRQGSSPGFIPRTGVRSAIIVPGVIPRFRGALFPLP